jgi:hypothetical protein
MPKKRVIQRARRDKREGKSPTTQAGEFVREEIHDIRQGRHGARSPKQAIAIGLSKARRAGVDLPPPEKGRTTERTRRSAERAYQLGHGEPPRRKPSTKRSRASRQALQREGTSAASHAALSKQARQSARQRSAAERSTAAQKAVRTKGPVKRQAAALKAVRAKGAAGRSAAARKAARSRAAST